MSDTVKKPDQLLHLVFGGELESLDDVRFKDLANLDIVGIYPNYATAEKAWQEKARGHHRTFAEIALFSSCTCTACWTLKTRSG